MDVVTDVVMDIVTDVSKTLFLGRKKICFFAQFWVPPKSVCFMLILFL
jgi:hypothetical protein